MYNVFGSCLRGIVHASVGAPNSTSASYARSIARRAHVCQSMAPARKPVDQAPDLQLRREANVSPQCCERTDGMSAALAAYMRSARGAVVPACRAPVGCAACWAPQHGTGPMATDVMVELLSLSELTLIGMCIQAEGQQDPA